MKAGKTLVADRYSYSVFFYSAALGLDSNWCKEQERGLPAPDLTIFLELSEKEAALRQGYGSERSKTLTFQTKVREQYGYLFDDNWSRINALASIEEVGEVVREKIIQVIRQCQEGKELKRL